ncbi:hypothetical protein [Paenibacillus macerans]|uniref:hypothetical protein n=1 Tax=Paenibacillus macerans TaxID=44252 RepID=UPI003D31D59D
MKEHLSRLDRYGHRNRIKQINHGSSTGDTQVQPMPDTEPRDGAVSAGGKLAAPDVMPRKEMTEEPEPYPGGSASPQLRGREKAPIGDETLVRLLIPRNLNTGNHTQASSVQKVQKKPASQPEKTYESAAVAALAKLKEPVRTPSIPSGRESGLPESLAEPKPDEGLSSPLLAMDLLASAGTEDELDTLPTRKELFPSQRLKMTRWFYNSLLYIFVIILIYLLWWGVSDSPWGKNHGL